MEIRIEDLPLPMQMRILRMVAGVSAQEMATRWGRSQAHVYRVERGDTDPTPLELRDAQALAADAYARTVARALRDVATSGERGAGGAVTVEAQAVLGEAEEVALDAEAATLPERGPGAQKQRRSAR